MRTPFEAVRDSLIAGLPTLTTDERITARSLYLLLAQGQPVTKAQVADTVGLPLGRVDQILSGLAEVEFDKTARIIAFRGLTLDRTPHSIHRTNPGMRTLYTWCAFDGLFMPGILGESLILRSRCPQTGLPIEMLVDPDRAVLSDSAVVISFPLPDKARNGGDLRSAFCCHVQFFSDREAGESWIGQRTDLEVLSISDALDLAAIRNAVFLGLSAEPAEPSRPFGTERSLAS